MKDIPHPATSAIGSSGEQHAAPSGTGMIEVAAQSARSSPVPGSRKFRAGDVVKHAPTGETWVLANDQDGPHVSPCGWPACLAYAVDCALVTAATDEKRMEKLTTLANLHADERDGPDHRITTARRQLSENHESSDTLHMKKDKAPSVTHAPENLQCGALSVAPGSAQSWKVRVVVCGTHAGDYEHTTYEAARADADEREKKYGVLGCHYRVIAPAGNLWCAMCGQWTNHQSGTCPELLPPNSRDDQQGRSP
jgi:hypothetical protein